MNGEHTYKNNQHRHSIPEQQIEMLQVVSLEQVRLVCGCEKSDSDTTEHKLTLR